MRKLLSLFTALLFVGSMWGTTAAVDDVLWHEAFTGTTTSTSTTFSADDAATISAIANSAKGTSMLVSSDISNLSYTASNVMLTASSGGNCSGAHIWVKKSSTGYFQAENIPLYGATKVCIIWNQGGSSKITASYKLDGGNWTNIKENSTAGANITSDEINTSGKSVIAVKFTRTSTNTNIRLDDLRVVVTEAPSTDPSVALDPTSINFGNVALGASVATQEITVLGENLTSALTVESSNEDVFTVAVKAGSSLTPDGDGNVSATLVITPITTAYGTFDEGIIISDGGLETDSLVPVSMHVGGIVTVTPASPDLAFGNVPQNATAADYAKTITVSATNLTAYKEIRVQAPLYFQASPINISADENGVIEETEVKLMPVTTYDAGDYGDVDAKFELVSTSPREFADIEIGAPTMTIIACTTLDKPSNVTVSNKVYPYNAVALAWDEVENADSYEVYIYQGETLIDADEVNTEAYTIGETLAAATTYSYQIIAKSEDAAYCESAVTSDDFTTEDLPAAVLTLSENGETRTWGEGLKITSEIALPTAVAAGNEVAGKVLVGWSEDADRATAPELAKGANYTMNETTVTLYAVYATESYNKVEGTPVSFTSGGSLNLLGIEGVTAEGLGSDYGGSNAPYLVKMDNTDDYIQFSLDYAPTSVSFGYKMIGGNSTSKMTITECATADGEYTKVEEFTISGTQNSTGTCTTTESFSQKYVRMVFTKGSNIGVGNIIVTGFVKSAPIYSNYTTTGVKAPHVTVDPTSVALEAGAVVDRLIDATYLNVDLANVAVTLFNDADCAEAFDGEWLNVSLNANKDIVYGASANTSYANARTAYIQLTAPATAQEVDPVVVVIPVTQAKKAPEFASFEDLVASDLPRTSGGTSNVQVTFENVDVQSVSSKNLYLKILDAEDTDGTKFIQIYCNTAMSESWGKGGKVSGASITGTWKLFDNAMELQVSSWEGINYTAPTFASFEELVVAELDNGQKAVVTFSNVKIHTIESSDVYIDVLDPDDKPLDIYEDPKEGWEEGGLLSGTNIECTWKEYSGGYYITLTNGWEGVTYTPTYAVTFDDPSNGTLVIKNGEDAIATGDKVAAGTTLTVTATPDEDFVIDEAIKVLKVGEDVDVTELVLSGSTLTMPAYAIKLSVSFKPQGGGTGVDNIHGDNIPTTKVLRDNQIYILRGDKTYTIDGQLVK